MRLTEENKRKLNLFFDDLAQFSYQGIFDTGLIVTKGAFDEKALAKILPKDAKAELIIVDRASFADDLIQQILKAFDGKKWPVLFLKDGFVHPRLYSQLRLLATMNRIQILHLGGDDNETNVRQPRESRVVVVLPQTKVSHIQNPAFMNLFGVVADIS